MQGIEGINADFKVLMRALTDGKDVWYQGMTCDSIVQEFGHSRVPFPIVRSHTGKRRSFPADR